MTPSKPKSAFSNALSGLKGWGAGATDEKQIVKIPLEHIAPDPNQPRREFDQEALQELAESIRQNGQMQPISVRTNPEGAPPYLIRFGERRWRACGLAGEATIDAIVSDAGSVPVQQLVENLQREDLGALEIANAIKALDMPPAEIATALGKSRQWVTYHMAIAKMPEEYREAMRSGAVNDVVTLYEAHQLSETHPAEAGALLARATAAKPLTRAAVRSLRDELRSAGTSDTTTASAPATPPKAAGTGASTSAASKAAAAGAIAHARVYVADEDGTEIGFLDLTKPTKAGKIGVIRGSDAPARLPIEALRITRVEPL